MEFYKKYKHIGNSYVSVPEGWVPIVEKALIEVEKKMWPKWIPMFIKRWIHYLATGNSVVRVKFWWAYELRKRLTGGQTIQEIKEKYATLRIYCHAGEEINFIIDKVIHECNMTCQRCGSKDAVNVVGERWFENLCEHCYVPTREIIIEKY